MKRWLGLLFVLLMLCGCSGKNAELDRTMWLRAQLLGQSCSFDADITADYGDKLYEFSLRCQGDPQGNLGFQVLQPDTIRDITGQFSNRTGKLTFDDVALEFPLLADDQVTPVSAPWLLLKTLQGGYLTSAGMEDDLLRLTINETYEDDALQLDIWLNEENLPVRGDILYAGRRILTLTIKDFRIQ